MKALRLIACLLAGLWLVWPAFGQTAQKAAEKPPVDVVADQMEVLQKDRIAIFTGKVEATRGDTRMFAERMVVHYEKKAASGDATKAGDSGFGNSEVNLVESSGGVRIVTPDQTITGDNSVLEVKTNILTVTGKVTVVQGKSVIHGEKLVADLDKKTSQMTGGRVKGTFVPQDSPAKAPTKK